MGREIYETEETEDTPPPRIPRLSASGIRAMQGRSDVAHDGDDRKPSPNDARQIAQDAPAEPQSASKLQELAGEGLQVQFAPLDSSSSLPGTKEMAEAQGKRLAEKLERRGISTEHALAIAEKTVADARGPIAVDDWMTMDADRFSERTRSVLEARGLTPDRVLVDPNLAEEYTRSVLEMEGLPNGNGGTEKLRGVASGHYSERGDGGIGIDLVAANKEGVPVPIEVKKYHQASAAHLEDRSIESLEAEVKQWKVARESLARHCDDEQVEPWERQMLLDRAKMDRSETGELPVQQMDDLWTCDRWLKVIKTPEGRRRMADIGVDRRYLDYDRLRSSFDLPEWQDILGQRTTVIVSESSGDVGRRLFQQAVFEKRSNRVIKIEL